MRFPVRPASEEKVLGSCGPRCCRRILPPSGWMMMSPQVWISQSLQNIKLWDLLSSLNSPPGGIKRPCRAVQSTLALCLSQPRCETIEPCMKPKRLFMERRWQQMCGSECGARNKIKQTPVNFHTKSPGLCSLVRVPVFSLKNEMNYMSFSTMIHASWIFTVSTYQSVPLLTRSRSTSIPSFGTEVDTPF